MHCHAALFTDESSLDVVALAIELDPYFALATGDGDGHVFAITQTHGIGAHLRPVQRQAIIEHAFPTITNVIDLNRLWTFEQQSSTSWLSEVLRLRRHVLNQTCQCVRLATGTHQPIDLALLNQHFGSTMFAEEIEILSANSLAVRS